MGKYASNITQEEYDKLTKSAEIMTDEKATCFINDECGFESSRIIIHHEREVYVSIEGTGYLNHKKIPCEPMYCSTDRNYVRFDVKGCSGLWFYEFINGDLKAVWL